MDFLDDLDNMLRDEGPPPLSSAPSPSEPTDRLERFEAFLANLPPPTLPENLTRLNQEELWEHDQRHAAAIAYLHEVQAREEAAHVFYDAYARTLKAALYLELREQPMTEAERNARIQTNAAYASALRRAEDHKLLAAKAGARLKAYKTVLEALQREQLRRGMALKYNV